MSLTNSATPLPPLQLITGTDTAVAQVQAEKISCSLTPHQDEQSLCFDIGNVQLDNCIVNQAFDFPVVMFTESSISETQSNSAFFRVKTVFCKSLHDDKPTLKSFSVGMNKICVHLEDLFLYDLLTVLAQYMAVIQQPRLSSDNPAPVQSSTLIPHEVEILMSELFEPLSAQTFEISEIYVELCVHASVKLFLAADRIPLKFNRFRVNKLFTLAEHFSQVRNTQPLNYYQRIFH